MEDDLPPPAENLVVKRVRKKRVYTPEQRERMCANLAKAREAAKRSKGKQKKVRDKQKLITKMKRERARHEENQKVELEYNELMNGDKNEEIEESEEEYLEEPKPRKVTKRRKSKPRRVKKKVKYYEESDSDEGPYGDEWIPAGVYPECNDELEARYQPRQHRSNNYPRQQQAEGYTKEDLELARQYRKRCDQTTCRSQHGSCNKFNMSADRI